MPGKGSINTTLGIIILVIIAGTVGGYIYWTAQDEPVSQTPPSSIPHSSQTPSPAPSAQDTEAKDWKTYRSNELGVEFQYPFEWNLEGGASLNTDCSNTNQKGNIVSIALHLPASGGFFIEGVNKEECTNKGLGFFHYAKSPSEITYKETVKFGNNIFYLDFGRVGPGTHAFHAYLFGDIKAVPSLHLYYNPLTLNIEKEYSGNEVEYKKEKELFTKMLSTFKFLE